MKFLGKYKTFYLGLRLLALLCFSICCLKSRADSTFLKSWRGTGIDFRLYKCNHAWNNLNKDRIVAITHGAFNSADSNISRMNGDSLKNGKYRLPASGFSVAFVFSSSSRLQFFNSREFRIGLEFFELSEVFDPDYAVVSMYKTTDYGGWGYFESADYLGLSHRSLTLSLEYLLNKIFARDFAVYSGLRLSGNLVQEATANYVYRKAYEQYIPYYHRDYIDYARGSLKVNSPFGYSVGIPIGFKFNLDCNFNVFTEYTPMLRSIIVKSEDDAHYFFNTFSFGLRYKFGRIDPADELINNKNPLFW